MARFSESDVPSSYAPGRKYWLRTANEGGNLRAAVEETRSSGGIAFNEREIIILIHGYNNHYGEAVQAYVGLRSRQYDLNKEAIRPPDLESELGDLHWPGDVDWQELDRLDFLCYPKSLNVAKVAAQRLAAFIEQQPSLLTVNFIAHSMGCRLTLETIDLLRHESNVKVGRVCLMAAAVPQFKVRVGGALALAISHAERVKVLYSPNDLVLKYAFPPGQTIAGGDEGFFPMALGRDRPPPDTAGISSDPVLVPGAGHSDYWGCRDSNASIESMRAVSSFFEFSTAPRLIDRRAIDERNMLPERRSNLSIRQIGQD
ncbi:MAG: alpha/beta hydrolase [Rhodocyclaceae bacterium]|nr:alpha/beta hydrolase [Rhodocyclaceae bacterium]